MTTNHVILFLALGLLVVVMGIVLFQLAKSFNWVVGLGMGFIALGGIIMVASVSSLPENKEITIGNVSMSCEEIMEDDDTEGIDKETVALYQKLKDSNVSQDEIEKVFSAVFSADELKTLERNAAKFQDSTKLDKMIRDHCEGDELHRQDVEQKRQDRRE